MVEKQTEKFMKKFRIENGLKFYSNDFHYFSKCEGIQRNLTIHNMPQKNGITKQKYHEASLKFGNSHCKNIDEESDGF